MLGIDFEFICEKELCVDDVCCRSIVWECG